MDTSLSLQKSPRETCVWMVDKLWTKSNVSVSTKRSRNARVSLDFCPCLLMLYSSSTDQSIVATCTLAVPRLKHHRSVLKAFVFCRDF